MYQITHIKWLVLIVAVGVLSCDKGSDNPESPGNLPIGELKGGNPLIKDFHSLDTEEKVGSFVETNFGKTIEEIKGMLWEHDEQFTTDQDTVFVGYSLDLPYESLKPRYGQKLLRFAGFALKFENGKLADWDPSFR